MDDLIKDGKETTGVGYYKEILFRKIDTKSDVIIRSLTFSGIRSGRVIIVGVSEFVIEEKDGEKISLRFDEITDLQ